VRDGYTRAYLLPRPTETQTVLRAEVEVTPAPDTRAEHVDLFGNRVLHFGVHHTHDGLLIDATSEVVVESRVVEDGEPWEEVARRVVALRGGEALSVRPLAGSSPYVPLDRHGAQLRELAREVFPPGRPIAEGTRELCQLIHSTFTFDRAFTDISTPLSVVLEARRGVCQDFAHVAAGCLRSLGLAARYVSGYLGSTPDDRPAVSHAWCSVWVPQQGWIDFDPTNGHLPADRHVTVAWGRDYGDVTPVRGVVIGPASRQTLEVQVTVTRP